MKDNIEAVRDVMAANMTETAPIYVALDAILDELVLLRAGLSAVGERVDDIDAEPDEDEQTLVLDTFDTRREARRAERQAQADIELGVDGLPSWVRGAKVARVWAVLGTENRGH